MKKLFILFILGMSFQSTLFSQELCETEPSYEYNDLISNSTYRNVDLLRYKFCVKVHIHVLRRANGTGGQTVANVNTAMGYLDAAYNPHDIYFRRLGNIHYIDNDAIFTNPNILRL